MNGQWHKSSIISGLKVFLSDVLAVFLPFRCHRCQCPTEFNTVICPECKDELLKSLHSPTKISDTLCPFDIYTMSSYTSMVSELVKIIKYRPSKKTVEIVADACLSRANLKGFFTECDVLVPVPMHSSRLAKRGFNQADALARAFADATRASYCCAVIRRRATRAQADCSEQERLTNLDNAFILSKSASRESFKGKRIVIIDDVATTGTTLSRCAECLKSLKPAEICALVVSHSYRRFAK